jgi:hypothetical protein
MYFLFLSVFRNEVKREYGRNNIPAKKQSMAETKTIDNQTLEIQKRRFKQERGKE